jgi:hypothetical protein
VQRERSEIWNRRASGSAPGEGSLRGCVIISGVRSPSVGPCPRYGRGLNTPHYLTVFGRPVSRVRICGGQRRCFKVPATKLMAMRR